METGYDPRSVANALLRVAQNKNIDVTHITLQKLLYFAHAHYLSCYKRPLLSGYFEAWRYGPVHPGVYGAFNAFGSGRITQQAKHFDFVNKVERDVPSLDDAKALGVVQQIVDRFGNIPASQLVELSHAPRGPWAYVVGQREKKTIFGTRIDNATILERHKFHKVSLDSRLDQGEPSEDSPFE